MRIMILGKWRTPVFSFGLEFLGAKLAFSKALCLASEPTRNETKAFKLSLAQLTLLLGLLGSAWALVPLQAWADTGDELRTIAILPPQNLSTDTRDDIDAVGWALQYMLSSRLQNIPGYRFRTAQETAAILRSTPQEQQRSSWNREYLDDLLDDLHVGGLIVGRYKIGRDDVQITYKLWQQGSGSLDKVNINIEHRSFQPSELLKESLNQIMQLFDIPPDMDNYHVEDKLPQLDMDDIRNNGKLNALGHTWNQFADHLIDNRPFIQELWPKYFGASDLPPDGRVLAGWIRLYNAHLSVSSSSKERELNAADDRFKKALEDNEGFLDATIGSIRTHLDRRHYDKARELIKKMKNSENLNRRHPELLLLEARYLAFTEPNSGGQTRSNLEKIASSAPDLLDGFQQIKEGAWAAYMLASFHRDLGQIGEMGASLEKEHPPEQLKKEGPPEELVPAFLLAELFRARKQYYYALQSYRAALRLREDLLGNLTLHARYRLELIHPRLLREWYLERQIQECLHLMHVSRLAGRGTLFRRFHQFEREWAHPGTVTAVAQDTGGMLYAGTSRGNLYSVTSQTDLLNQVKQEDLKDAYISESGNAYKLRKDQLPATPAINSLQQHPHDGSIWIGTVGWGLFRYMDGKVTSKPYRSEGRYNNRAPPQDFVIDASGDFWLSTEDREVHRCRYQRLDLICERIGWQAKTRQPHVDKNSISFTNTELQQPRPSLFIKDPLLIRDPKGPPLLAADRQFFAYDAEKNKFKPLSGKLAELEDEQIDVAVLATTRESAPRRRLWFATSRREIGIEFESTLRSFAWEGDTRTIEPVLIGPGIVKTLLTDPDGGIWIGTAEQGLLKYSGSVLQPWNEFLATRNVFSLFSDRENLFWVGTDKGITSFDFDAIERFDSSQGLSGVIYSISKVADDELFLATGDGAYHFQDDYISEISLPGVEDYLSRKIFATIYDDTTRSLWFRNQSHLFRLFPRLKARPDRMDSRFPMEYGKPLSIKLLDKDKNLGSAKIAWDQRREGVWVNLFEGLGFVKNESVETLAEGTSPVSSELFKGCDCRPSPPAIDQEDGALWIGAGAKIYRIETDLADGLANQPMLQKHLARKPQLPIVEELPLETNGSFEKLPSVSVIRVTNEGMNKVLWVGTTEGLFKCMQNPDEQLKCADKSKKAGLDSWSRGIRDIRLDGESVWLATEDGLVHYHIGLDAFTKYDHRHGLPYTGLRAVLSTDSNRVWIGTESLGLATFRLTTTRPIVRMVEEKAEPDGSISFMAASQSYRQRNADFRYQWKCKPSCVSAAMQISKSPLRLDGLKPGDYELSVVSVDRDFNMSKSPTTTKFKIPSPFYATYWFWAVVLGTVLSLLLVWYLNTPKIARRRQLYFDTWAYVAKIRRKPDCLLGLVYHIYKKTPDPILLLGRLRTRLTETKVAPHLCKVLADYQELSTQPASAGAIAETLTKTDLLVGAKAVEKIYRIIEQMQKIDTLPKARRFDLELDGRGTLSSAIAEPVLMPPFVSRRGLEFLLSIDKALSILTLTKHETNAKANWYYLAAAESILRNQLSGVMELDGWPEREPLIGLAQQYIILVENEMSLLMGVAQGRVMAPLEMPMLHHMVAREYPYPIAHLHMVAQQEDNPALQSDSLCGLGEVLIRILCFLVIPDFLRLPTATRLPLFRKMCKQPLAFIEWADLLQKMAHEANWDGRPASVPQLTIVLTTEKTKRLIGDIVRLRNKIVCQGRRDVRTVDEFQKSIDALLGQLTCLRDLTLLLYPPEATTNDEQTETLLEAVGASEAFGVAKVHVEFSVRPGDVVLLNRKLGGMDRMFPFLIYEQAAGLRQRKLFYLSEVVEEVACYQSISGKHRLERESDFEFGQSGDQSSEEGVLRRVKGFP